MICVRPISDGAIALFFNSDFFCTHKAEFLKGFLKTFQTSHNSLYHFSALNLNEWFCKKFQIGKILAVIELPDRLHLLHLAWQGSVGTPYNFWLRAADPQ